MCLVKYERSKEINDTLSELCDVRIIWGGDQTIAEVRKSQLSARATEITFADRYSLAVIDAESYLAMEDKEKVAVEFYNDTYLSDQNACTSPRVIVWTGNQKEEAKKVFWAEAYKLVRNKYLFQDIQSVDKLSQAYVAAAEYVDEEDSNKGLLYKEVSEDNLLIRIKVSKLSDALMKYRGNSGYFYEYDCEDILELRDFCNNTHCQTIGFIGQKEMLLPLLKSGIRGVDRVVPMGHTMDFDLIWDGYNLVNQLTRVVDV